MGVTNNVMDVTSVTGVTSSRGSERRAQWARANREDLVERIAQYACEDGTVEPLPGLYLTRVTVPGELVHSVLEPSLCVIAQGSKEVLQGESRYHYDPDNYL